MFFYERFCELCEIKGVKPGRACSEMGVSRGLAAKWKATNAKKPSADVLEKMSKYFQMSINEILSPETVKAPIPEDERQISDDDLKFALFGGVASDAQFEEVKRFAKFIKERDGNGSTGG